MAVQKTQKCKNDDRKISWSAFHQEKLIDKNDCCRISTSTLLPLINESINSSAIVAHCMRVIRKVIQHLNPAKISIRTGDQPVHALMRQVQWYFPNEFKEQHFFIGTVAFHIEMAIVSLKGNSY